MLYKKIHRQYVKEFREGRQFRFKNEEIFTIITKPGIDRDFIWIDSWVLIDITTGQIKHKNNIIWLED